jgi:hypothetical protein
VSERESESHLPNRCFCFWLRMFQEKPTSFSLRFLGLVMITPCHTSPESASLISVGRATNSRCLVFFRDRRRGLSLEERVREGGREGRITERSHRLLHCAREPTGLQSAGGYL